jgi:16S rRNA (uracil1498-N3)-methyltransferase
VRLTRVFVAAPLASGRHVTLAGSAAGHITRVLRLRVGDAVSAFDGQGGEFAATLEQAHGATVTLAIGEQRNIERESPLAITLAQGISRGERMDLVVQKATELGVTQIVPLITARSVVRLDHSQAQKKSEHWRAVAISACEQCGRNRVPHIAAPTELGPWLATLRAAPPTPGSARVLLSPLAQAGLGELGESLTAVTVLIGPEGGLSGPEQEAASAAAFTAIRLGPRVLRTETAAIAALALLQGQFGDL